MALALAAALPGALEKAAAALDLSQRKDFAGHRLMQQMSQPRRPRKDEDPNKTYWVDDPESLERLGAYCCRDVEVERQLYTRLPPLSHGEQQLWILHQIINHRGFHVDRALAEAARR